MDQEVDREMEEVLADGGHDDQSRIARKHFR